MGAVVTKSARLRPRLVQLSLPVKLFFFLNSFMSNFNGEAKLFWKNCLAKYLTNSFIHCKEQEMKEVAKKSYFFQLHLSPFICESIKKELHS